MRTRNPPNLQVCSVSVRSQRMVLRTAEAEVGSECLGLDASRLLAEVLPSNTIQYEAPKYHNMGGQVSRQGAGNHLVVTAINAILGGKNKKWHIVRRY